MRKYILSTLILISFTSCYTISSTVGSGPQKNEVTKYKNHYLIDGLVPLGVKDTKEYVGDATNYKIETKHNFLDWLFLAITGGIYTPTTTIVTK